MKLEEAKPLIRAAIMWGAGEFLRDYHAPNFHTVTDGLDDFADYLKEHAYRLAEEVIKASREQTNEKAKA